MVMFSKTEAVVTSVNLQGLSELRGNAAASLQSDNVLAQGYGARRLASALSSPPWSINFWRTDGTLEALARDLVRGIFTQTLSLPHLNHRGA